MNRNLVLIDGEDGAEVDIAYSVADASGENKVITKTVTLPYLCEMGTAKIIYDSLDFVSKNVIFGKDRNIHYINGSIRIKREYSEAGAEHFQINNRSSKNIFISVIGNNKLELPNISNGDELTQPYPLYHGIPILYLVKPDLLPNVKIPYDSVTYYKIDNGLTTYRTKNAEIYLNRKNIETRLKTELPISFNQVTDIYKDAEENLFLSQSDWSSCIAGNTNNWWLNQLLVRRGQIFKELKPNEKWKNNGELLLLTEYFSYDVMFDPTEIEQKNNQKLEI